ncbi:MAG: hypothetical protein ACJARS_002823 [bacterium]|jgi:hypothetical protein
MRYAYPQRMPGLNGGASTLLSPNAPRKQVAEGLSSFANVEELSEYQDSELLTLIGYDGSKVAEPGVMLSRSAFYRIFLSDPVDQSASMFASESLANAETLTAVPLQVDPGCAAHART